MGKFIDLTGQRFGRLTVIERAMRVKGKNAFWVCRCDCGNTVKIDGSHLRRKLTLSCGCLHRELLGARVRTHGGKGSRLYRIWRDMKSRCYNPKTTRYSDYGGRGIYICEEWKNNFAEFQAWALENGYTENLSIDRISNRGPYDPLNCRWVDAITQQNNKRTNRFVKWRGERHTVAEWARIVNIPYRTIVDRLNRGWNIERALTEPVHKKK